MKARKGEIGPFPADLKPVRPGVYRVSHRKHAIVAGYAYFDGSSWYNSDRTIELAISWILYGYEGTYQDKIWCGLSKEPT